MSRFFRRLKEKVTKPKAGISLTLSKNTFSLGEDLKGALLVSSEEEFDATEVRAELRCVERKRKTRREYDEHLERYVERDYWETATLHSANPKASGPLHITPGYKKEFPFSTNVPAGGRVSYDSVDASVTWSIKGVIGIKGRPDVTSKTVEVQVVRPAAPPVVKEKEIIREVVMIPCSYCRALMPQTSTFCPNCGAKRRA